MIRVLHISDTHFLRSYEGRGGAEVEGATAYDRMLAAMGDVTAGLRDCLVQGCAQGVDLIVLTGDLTDDGDEGDYRALRDAFDGALAQAGAADAPVLVTPGNHDHVGALRRGWLGQGRETRELRSARPYVQGTPRPCAPCSRTSCPVQEGVGEVVVPDQPRGDEAPLLQVAEVGGVVFVSFDTSRFGCADGYVDEARVAGLAAALDGVTGAPVVLVTHHHLDPAQFSTPAVLCPESFWECLAAHDVRAILCGHTHHQAHGRVRGIPYYTADGLSFQGENLVGRAGVGFFCAWGYNRYEIDEAGLVRSATTHTFTDGRDLGAVVFGR